MNCEGLNGMARHGGGTVMMCGHFGAGTINFKAFPSNELG